MNAVRVALVRHGEAAADWSVARDPPLSPRGREQARAAARAMAASSPRPRALYVSPLRRCRETAAAFTDALGLPAQVAPALTELPSPASLSVETRGPWLRAALDGDWEALIGGLDAQDGARITRWRAALEAFVMARTHGCALITHFVAINALVGRAQGARRVAVFRPDNASITALTLAAGEARVASLGAERRTDVLPAAS